MTRMIASFPTSAPKLIDSHDTRSNLFMHELTWTGSRPRPRHAARCWAAEPTTGRELQAHGNGIRGGDEATGSSRQIKSLPGRWNAAFQLCGTHARWLPRPSHILLLVHAASSKYSILMLQLKWAHDRTEANGSDDSSNKTLHFHRASMRVCLPHSSALEWCSHLSAFAPASCAP